MASWLKWLARLFAGTPPPPKLPKVRRKSAERIANEKLILDTRRQILAKLEVFRAERASKQRVIEAIDQDTLRATEVVQAMLHDLESGKNS